jgi:hypothetical protein
VFSVQDEIEATIKKLNLWCNRIEKEKYDSFHTLSDFIELPLSSDVAEVQSYEVIGVSTTSVFSALSRKKRLDEHSLSRLGI